MYVPPYVYMSMYILFFFQSLPDSSLFFFLLLHLFFFPLEFSSFWDRMWGEQDRKGVFGGEEEGGGVGSGPGSARTILLFHIISARPSKQPLMVRT